MGTTRHAFKIRNATQAPVRRPRYQVGGLGLSRDFSSVS